jgi:colanic acid/amylovoran biosynthesis glycosyltransferase
MPRLLVITGELPVPSETFVVGHIRGMRQRGWTVAAAAYTLDRERLADAFEKDVPELFELEPRATQIRERNRLSRWWTMRKLFGPDGDTLFHPGGGKKQRSRAAALLEVARRWGPDVIHAHFGPLGLMAAPVAKKLGIPLLVNFRGYDFLSYTHDSGWDPYSVLPENAIAVGHTQFCEDILQLNLRVRVEHVRRGVDRQRFAAHERRNAWGDTVRLLVAGRLMFSKGHHLAIDTIVLLRRMKRGVDFDLTLAGGAEAGGAVEAALLRRAAALGVNVRLTGALKHDEVADEMRKADIQLIPSLPRADGWVENFCTVASEGLASGLCIVAVNNGGVPEAVNGAGVLVPAGSALELARGVIQAMEQASPAQWAAIALAKAATYSDSDMMDDYERVTHAAIGGAHG